MYKILPKPLLFAAFAWLIAGLFIIQPLLLELTHYNLKWTSIPGLAWLVFSALVFKPVWRFFWRHIPWLASQFPDLNGVWDVTLCSNWPRQEQILAAAIGSSEHFDMKHAEDQQLAPLRPVKLKAEINQTWWSIQMILTNPTMDTPIDGSETIYIDPKAADGLTPPSISYIYKQTNSTDTVSDDSEFFGAARLTYNAANDCLNGVFWTARMWRRAMNTAGTITLTRC